MPLNYAGLTLLALDKPISKLSADHFSIIAKFLELKDIQSARLASRELYFFLSPYLIKSVRFAAQGDQLALLAKISQNDVFRRSVRTLRYDVNLHELPVSTWNELDAEGFQVKPRCTLGDIYGYPPVQPYHVPPRTAFRLATLEESANFEAEQTLINKHLEVHLCHVLESFPGISTVVFTISSTNYEKELNDHFEPDARQMIRPYQFLSLTKSIKKSGSRITNIDVEAPWLFTHFPRIDDWDYQGSDRVTKYLRGSFLDIQTASPDSSDLLTKHHCTRWRLKKPLVLSCTFNPCPENLSPIKFVFSNLTHFSLVIHSGTSKADYLDGKSPESRQSFYWSCLPEVLRSLQNVTHFSLDLELSGVDYDHLPFKNRDNVAELFHDPLVTFPRLTSLSLANLQTCAQSLLFLLQRHPAVQDLSLRYLIEVRPMDFWVKKFPFRNTSPGWFEVIEAMRALRLQRLELSRVEGPISFYASSFIRIDALRANQREAKVYAYILHGYGPNPFGPGRHNVDDWDAELW